jgi:hypothetical protein
MRLHAPYALPIFTARSLLTVEFWGKKVNVLRMFSMKKNYFHG